MRDNRKELTICLNLQEKWLNFRGGGGVSKRVICEGETASDSAKLGGQLPAYYGTKAAVDSKAPKVSPVFTGNVTMQNAVINMIDGHYIYWNTGWFGGAANSSQYILCKAPAGHGDRQIIFGIFAGSWAFISNNSCNLGHPAYYWANEYFQTAPIIASDANVKENVAPIPPEVAKDFIAALQPKTYKYVDNTSGRTHYGMIAQDVEQAMVELGMSSLDFAGLIKSPKTERVQMGEDEFDEPVYQDRIIEGEYVYGLRYEEFIAPMIATIQEQQKTIDGLKALLVSKGVLTQAEIDGLEV